LGFVGPREEAAAIRDRLEEFLSQKLKLTLSAEKTLITHAADESAKFLGYEVNVVREKDLIANDGRRATNGCITLRMPHEVVSKYSSRYSRNGKILHRAELLADDDFTIVSRYQAVLRGLYNYYCWAVNVSKRMNRIERTLWTSLMKTLASKHGSTVSTILRRYQTVQLDRKVVQVVVARPGKEPLVAVYGGIPFERKTEEVDIIDSNPLEAWFYPASKRSEVVQRLLANRCEVCGAEGPVQMHHIRKLADIDRPGRRPKENWEKIMSARRRKTLAVCKGCHNAIHAGRHDGPRI
jgi:hypothetical protein